MAEDRKADIKDYERLGRAVESVFETGYANKRRVFLMNFGRGVAFGLGAALGGTLAVAAILYALSQLSDIPLIGDIAEALRNSIDTN